MSRCFVMQPFDNAEFDRRFDEIYGPAIEAAGFDAYRVDRDPGASIPIQTIESEIRSSAACFVDISVDNPNVWFEFGFAISALKPVCIVSSKQRERFPFDIQHRKVIRYDTKAPSDFVSLQKAITERLVNIAKSEVDIEPAVSRTQNSISTQSLSAVEFQVLCVMFEIADGDLENVAFSNIQNGMDRLGYTKLAARVGVAKLNERSFIKEDKALISDDRMWYLLEDGKKYVLDNVEEASLRHDGGVPF